MTRPWTSSTTPQFTNNGDGVEWIPFDFGWDRLPPDGHDGRPDHGVAAAHLRQRPGDLERPGQQRDVRDPASGPSDALPVISRNGNLQITQFYYGAAQPSNAAALIAGALFYGSAQDNGGPFSDPASSATATSYGTGPAATPAAWPPTSKATARFTSTGGRAAAAATPTSSRSTASARPTACSRPAAASRPPTRSGPCGPQAAPISPSTRSTARTSSSARPSAGSSPPPTRA